MTETLCGGVVIKDMVVEFESLMKLSDKEQSEYWNIPNEEEQKKFLSLALSKKEN